MSKSNVVTVRGNVSEETRERMRYWAAKQGISLNEWLGEAIELKIAHANGDYDLPTAEQHRLNQLIEVILVLSSNTKNLERTFTAGIETLLNTALGDGVGNYLAEVEKKSKELTSNS